NYRPGNLAINGGTRPFISYDRQTWTPLPDFAVEWDKAVPLLRIHVTPARSPVWIAHVPPYTMQNLASLLADLKHNPDIAVDEIGKSAGGRNLLMLTVTSHTRPARDEKVLWLMAREHAWESGTSWVMDGAVRFLAKDDPAAARLRDSFIFKVFPMADPDGVARGGVRFNLNGYDVNRNWDVADPKLMPETASFRKAVLDWTDSGHSIDLFVNLHNDNNDYIEGPLSAAGPDYRQTVDRFATMLTKETFFALKTRDWPPGELAHGRMDTCQDLFHERKIPTLLLEQSVQKNTRLGRLLDAADYRRFGERLVTAMAAAVGGSAGENLLPNAGFAPGANAM
ncbi:MAG: M14 family zinc carboxypeptidase, partial [Bryobacteraceae bacterium]